MRDAVVTDYISVHFCAPSATLPFHAVADQHKCHHSTPFAPALVPQTTFITSKPEIKITVKKNSSYGKDNTLRLHYEVQPFKTVQ
jgi:hypothetical protein